jgi:hypothetical protein
VGEASARIARGAGQGTDVWTWPGKLMLIIPAHMQVHIDILSSAGILPSITVAAPGVHGAVVAGTHGIGVSTPRAAAVAAATSGFAGLMHIPNGAMFAIGAKSMIVAAGILEQFTIGVGSAVSVDGAMPIVHIIIAPETT